MDLTINGEKKEIANGSLSIIQLLSLEKVKSPEMVSVQLNGDFVKKAEYENVSLHNGDVLDFLYFMGGGK